MQTPNQLRWRHSSGDIESCLKKNTFPFSPRHSRRLPRLEFNFAPAGDLCCHNLSRYICERRASLYISPFAFGASKPLIYPNKENLLNVFATDMLSNTPKSEIFPSFTWDSQETFCENLQVSLENHLTVFQPTFRWDVYYTTARIELLFT